MKNKYTLYAVAESITLINYPSRRHVYNAIKTDHELVAELHNQFNNKNKFKFFATFEDAKKYVFDHATCTCIQHRYLPQEQCDFERAQPIYEVQVEPAQHPNTHENYLKITRVNVATLFRAPYDHKYIPAVLNKPIVLNTRTIMWRWDNFHSINCTPKTYQGDWKQLVGAEANTHETNEKSALLNPMW